MNPTASASIGTSLRISSAVALGFAGICFSAGCVSHSRPPRGPFAGAPPEIGRVAVVVLANAPGMRLQLPYSSAEIWREPLAVELIQPSAHAFAVMAAQMAPYGPQAIGAGTAAVGVAPLVLAGTAIVAHEVRRVYGTLIADSDAAVAHAHATLAHAASHAGLERRLGERLLAEVQRTLPAARATQLPVAPAAPATGRRSRLPSGMSPEFNYAPLAARGIDTVLELKLLEPQLSGADGINPALALGLHVRVRAVSTHDGRELYYDYLEFRGEGRTFVAWAADNASAFRAEVERAIAVLGAEAVAQAFGRGASPPISHEQLAAVGLSRRWASHGWREPAYPGSEHTVRAPAAPRSTTLARR